MTLQKNTSTLDAIVLDLKKIISGDEAHPEQFSEKTAKYLVVCLAEQRRVLREGKAASAKLVKGANQ